MKDRVLEKVSGYQRSFSSFTAGQKVVAILGTGALLLAGVMVFRWVSQPDYAPLFSKLSSEDASAVIEQLDSQGVKYKITNGGDTVMVPRNDVYKTRIQLSGEGLPSGSDGGYSLLDEQDLSTSQFKEQTDFKRAMEGELTKTIEAMDGVQSAVVHLAIPAKQVFADKQDPPTASVLVGTRPGDTLGPEQVQSVVHLVAASIDGMEPEKVTVADSSGKLLSTTDAIGGAAASSRSQYVNDFQNQKASQVQALLDRVLGPGNSTVQVTADLDFDKTVTESRKYAPADPNGLSLSSTTNTEDYTGPAGTAAAGGTVGPDGQMDSTTTGGTAGSSYKKESTTSDSALNTTTEHRENAPGAVQSLHIAAASGPGGGGEQRPQGDRADDHRGRGSRPQARRLGTRLGPPVRPQRGGGGRQGRQGGEGRGCQGRPDEPVPQRLHRRAGPARPRRRLDPWAPTHQAAQGSHDVRRRAAAQRRRPPRGGTGSREPGHLPAQPRGVERGQRP